MGLPTVSSMEDTIEVMGENAFPYDRRSMTHQVEVALPGGKTKLVTRKVTTDFHKAVSEPEEYDYYQAEDGRIEYTPGPNIVYGFHEKGWFVKGKWKLDNRKNKSTNQPLDEVLAARKRGE